MRTIIETGLFLSGGFLISILQGLILIPNILLISYKKRLFDQPDERKVHSIPVSPLGRYLFLPGDTRVALFDNRSVPLRWDSDSSFANRSKFVGVTVLGQWLYATLSHWCGR